jgi:peptidoglycan hydrolase CwlO-like protein
MTEEDRLLLVNLKANAQQLFKKINSLEKEKELLQNEVMDLQNKIGELEREKSDLCRKNEQLKIASQLTSGKGGSEDAKQKINFLVREIDNCIALLNK